MKLKLVSYLLFCLSWQYSNGQINCPTTNTYKTKSLGDGLDSSRLLFPLNFIITADSIIISFDPAGKKEFAAFRIINKECFWDQDFLEGRSKYKLMLYSVTGNKHPTLTIIQNKNKPVYIELLYENGEKRIFM